MIVIGHQKHSNRLFWLGHIGCFLLQYLVWMWKLLVVPVCSKSWMAAAKTMARISSSLSQCCVEMHRHVALSLSLCHYSNVVSVTMSPVCNIRKWAVCVTSAAWIRLWYGFLYLLYPISSASTNCTRAWTGIWKHSTTDSKETLNWKLYTAEQLVCAQLKGYKNMYVFLSLLLCSSSSGLQ